jgi:hypothetical protein
MTDIMRRAWAIFRETYGYPSIPFRSIGRECFGWALRKAWAEARAAAELSATPTEALAARIEGIEREIDSLKYRNWGTNVSRETDRLRDEAGPLVAELFRRSVEIPLALAA